MGADAHRRDERAYRHWLGDALGALPSRAQALFAAACATRLRNAVEPELTQAHRAAFGELKELLDAAWNLATKATLDEQAVAACTAAAEALEDASVDPEEESPLDSLFGATQSTLSSLTHAEPSLFGRLVSRLGGERSPPPSYFAAISVLEHVDRSLETGELKDVEDDERFWQHRRTQQELDRQERDLQLLADAEVRPEVMAGRLRGAAEREAV